MANKSPKQNKCVYNECVLPENNNFYIWQIIFLLFSLLAFWTHKTAITSFNCALFLIPVILDLFYTNVKGKLLKGITKTILFFDCIAIICTFLNMMGIIYEVNGFFQIDVEYFGTKIIPFRECLLVLTTINIIVPIIFKIGRPTKKSMFICQTAQSLKQK